MIELWNWLSGKKTAIAAALLMIAVVLNEVLVGIWGVDAVALKPTIETLNWFGVALGGVGLAHKAVKR